MFDQRNSSSAKFRLQGLERCSATVALAFLTIVVLMPAEQARAQSIFQVVVPSTFLSVEAGSHLAYPWGCEAGSSLRQQQAYDGAEVGKGEIIELRFRQDADLGTAFGPVTLFGVTVRLASTDQAIETLSLIFADNLGTDAKIVFQGDLTLSSAASGAVPRPRDIVVPLTTPFFFDGTDGTNLVLDVTIPTCVMATAFDAAFVVGDAVARIWENQSNATVATRTDSAGLVTELIIRLLFTDGFESGNLNAWSMAAP